MAGRGSTRVPPGFPQRLLGCSAARGRFKVPPRFPQAFLKKSLRNACPRFPQGSPEVPPRFPQGSPGSPKLKILKESLRKFSQGSPKVPPRGCSAARLLAAGSRFPQGSPKLSLRNPQEMAGRGSPRVPPRFHQGSPKVPQVLPGGCSAARLRGSPKLS